MQWRLVEATATNTGGGVVELNVDDTVRWQALVNGLGGGHEVLEWQALLVARLDVTHHAGGGGGATSGDDAVAVTLSCSGVAAFFIDPTDPTHRTFGPFAGNPYFGSDRVPVTVRLPPGRHVLRMRPRIKHAGQVRSVH